MIYKFVLKEILHHVGISWIICSNREMKYKIDEINHPDWLNRDPWYKPAIYSRFHGSLFEYFITHERIDRYNIMCYLVAHDKNNLLTNIKKSVLRIG